MRIRSAGVCKPQSPILRGGLAIVGSLESGLSGQTLFAKSVLDGIASIVMASSLSIGVPFSAASVFIYQGLISWRHRPCSRSWSQPNSGNVGGGGPAHHGYRLQPA
ncbi:MAG TPA: DUF554 family protein [Syntrophomonadaceae bacterium]|nr:DUF554 family protein [Syntrophomonadaceae bacterium]